jgi:hypothetical protein
MQHEPEMDEYARQEELRVKSQLERERKYKSVKKFEEGAGEEVRGDAKGGGEASEGGEGEGGEAACGEGGVGAAEERGGEQEAAEDERPASRAGGHGPEGLHCGLPAAERKQAGAQIPPGRAGTGRDGLTQHAYDFIYTQKEIGLENEMSEIEVLIHYPPQLLTEFQQTFQEIFPDSNQENFIIKEKH